MNHLSINISESTTAQSHSGRLAVLILAHKDPAQLSRLISSLDDPHFDIYVHIDKKSDITPFLNIQQPNFSNIVYIDNRVPTHLNDFSLVNATMQLVKRSYRENEYSYYILLTGQDYPIKSNDYIYNYLNSNYPVSFIDSYTVDDAVNAGIKWPLKIASRWYGQGIRRKLSHLFGHEFYSKHKIARLPAKLYDIAINFKNSTPAKEVAQLGFKYSAGSHFWILPDIAIKYLIQIWDQKLPDIFKHTAAPEESYFQTALTNCKDIIIPECLSQFNSITSEMDNPALRLIKWYENGVHTTGHPAIWDIDDLPTILSAKALFARKVDPAYSSELLNHLDKLRQGSHD